MSLLGDAAIEIRHCGGNEKGKALNFTDLWRIEYLPPRARGMFGTGPMSEGRWVAHPDRDGESYEGATVQEVLNKLGIDESEFAAALQELGTGIDRTLGLMDGLFCVQLLGAVVLRRYAPGCGPESTCPG